jgi:hypothetical protein
MSLSRWQNEKKIGVNGIAWSGEAQDTCQREAVVIFMHHGAPGGLSAGQATSCTLQFFFLSSEA